MGLIRDTVEITYRITITLMLNNYYVLRDRPGMQKNDAIDRAEAQFTNTTSKVCVE